MFSRLGEIVSRHWLLVMLSWLAIVVAIRWSAPAWDDVTHDGDFAFLPADVSSVVGQQLTEVAFPDFEAKSQIVFVMARDDGPLRESEVRIADQLAQRLHNELAVASFHRAQRAASAEPSADETTADASERDAKRALQTAEAALTEALRLDESDAKVWHNLSLLRSELGLVADAEAARQRALELDANLAAADPMLPRDAEELPLVDIWTRHNEVFGSKLVSDDKQALLIVAQLSTEFMATENIALLEHIQVLLADVRSELREQNVTGVRIGISGSAAVGADMLRSAAESIANTEYYTVTLVVLILLVVYRAPLLILVPILTIGVSLTVALGVVAALTQFHLLPGMSWWSFKVFTTTRIFIVVILFGAGTDFCLFLISRFREELEKGVPREAATGRALEGVGNALVASALTTVLGLGMMFFAEFGKFRNSGPAIGICLAVTLLACLTLAPALLRALGSAVFWPWPTTALHRRSTTVSLWNDLARHIVARPGMILLVSVLLMAPLAARGIFSADQVTFDLLSGLQRDRPSIIGSSMLRQHFPIGESGPVIVLLRKEGAGFDTEEKGTAALAAIHDLTVDLLEIEGVTAVRSMAEPLGDPPQRLSILSSAGRKKLFLREHQLTKSIFLAQPPPYAGNVTRLEIILGVDPFSKQALNIFERIEQRLAAVTARNESFWTDAEFSFTGTTAGIRDLRTITQIDQRRIQILVVLAVFGILWLLLRHFVICLYLIVSVVFSYLVTIGATELFFQWSYGDSFQGLDWKVPVFLFVILVAVGEDYNIYLVTRVFQEQARSGPFAGLREAIVRTGGIITSCGLIMAGTFVSMTTGSLRGIVELGFALSLGVLLDTFVVRPILVPAFLALWCRWTSSAIRAKPLLIESEGPRDEIPV